MSDIWTVKRILDWIEGYLAEKGIENPRLSAQWLVSDALGCSRLELYTDLERPLTDAERDVLRGYTKRRGEGEPLQYITGKTDFRFVSLHIEPGVLIPRPETEVLVSEALTALKEALQEDDEAPAGGSLFEGAESPASEESLDGVEGLAENALSEDAHVEVVVEPEIPEIRVVDLCTGSGNIACSIAHELPHARVYATDISPTACALAARNAEALGLTERVHVFEGDLEQALPSELKHKVHLLISNPPYIPSAVLSSLDAEVTEFEPALALDGGADGLDVFRRILLVADEYLCEGGVLALELFEEHLDSAARLAQESGFKGVRTAFDLAGKPRILVAYK